MKRSSERVNLYQLHRMMRLDLRRTTKRRIKKLPLISCASYFFYQLPKKDRQCVHLTDNSALKSSSLFLRCLIRHHLYKETIFSTYKLEYKTISIKRDKLLVISDLKLQKMYARYEIYIYRVIHNSW